MKTENTDLTITLNLLTPERKRDLGKRLVFLVLKNGFAVILIMITGVAATLLVAKLALSDTFDGLVLQGALITREYSGINTEIRTVNSELGELADLAKQSYPAAPLLAHLFSISPEGISITSLSADTVSKQVSIRGRAATREILVGFHAALESSTFLTSVQSPLSNLVLKTNIPFQFEATLTSPTPPPPVSADADDTESL